MEFNHFDENGNALMVDVTSKEVTERSAAAKGKIKLSSDVLNKIKAREVKKGDVLGVARVAGIMAAKKTSELIPLCHLLSLTKAEIEFFIYEDSGEIEAVCTVKTVGKTGVEMEAMTGVSVCLLTIYDMCKAFDKQMEIGGIYLAEKTGGKSGIFQNKKLL